jgi:hypothetical protein
VFRARNRRENSNPKSDSDTDASNKENKKERGREKKKRSASTSSGSGSSSRRFAFLALMILFNCVKVPAHVSEYGDKGTQQFVRNISAHTTNIRAVEVQGSRVDVSTEIMEYGLFNPKH